jgi:hypothetical protein
LELEEEAGLMVEGGGQRPLAATSTQTEISASRSS